MIPYGFVSSIIDQTKGVYPWMSRDALMSTYHKRTSQQATSDTSTNISHSPCTIYTEPRVKSGRHVGLTADKKSCNELTLMAGKKKSQHLLSKK